MVNTVSRSNHSFKGFLESEENPSKLIGAFLAQLNENIEHLIREKQIDVDNFLYETGATGQISLTDQIRGPFKATDIFATWNSNAFPTTYSRSNFAATVNGTAQLPAGYEITGFDVTLNAGAAQAYTTVVVSGTNGNNITYQISSPAAGGESVLSIRYQNPIPAANAATQIGITLTGTVNTGAGSVVVYGIAATSVVIQIGQRFFNPNPAAGQFELTGMNQGIQVLQKDPVTFTVTPPVACHFEMAGYADYRKVDRR